MLDYYKTGQGYNIQTVKVGTEEWIDQQNCVNVKGQKVVLFETSLGQVRKGVSWLGPFRIVGG